MNEGLGLETVVDRFVSSVIFLRMKMFLPSTEFTVRVRTLRTRLRGSRPGWPCCAPWKGRAVPCGSRLAGPRTAHPGASNCDV